MSMVYIITSIVLALFVGFFTSWALRVLPLREDTQDADQKVKLGVNGWLMVIGTALLAGVVYFCGVSMFNSVLSVVCWIVSLLMLAGVVVWWFFHSDKWKELIPFLLLIIPLGFISFIIANALGMPLIVKSGPTVIAMGLVIAMLAFYRWKDKPDLSDAVRRKNKTGFCATVGLVVVALVPLVVVSALALPVDFGAKTAFGSEVAASIKVTEEEYNSQAADALYKKAGVSDELNNSSLSAKDEERVKSTGCSDALTFGMSSDTDAGKMDEVRREIMTNPVYCITVIKALKDKKIGDQTIGSYNPWMNTAITKDNEHGLLGWCEYRDGDKSKIYLTSEYRQTATATVALVNRFVVQGVQNRTTVENWCLNGASLDNQRKGVLASYQYTDDFLVLAYIGKNERGKASATGLLVFGFNIHDKRPAFFGNEPEVVTVTDNPSGGDNPGGGGDNPSPGPGPDPGPNPPGPTPGPDEPKKDPSKLTPINTEPNDNTGPGENTIDPSDPNHSTKDRSDNSTSYSSAAAVKEWTDHLADVNETQRVGGDSNQPSTETPSGTTVDNNAEKGTGNGGIDKPTSTSQPAEEASTGAAISNNSSNAAVAWGDGNDPI